MTTKTVNLYTFEELSDSAKEKARNWYRDCNARDNSWSESTIEDATIQGSNMGLDIGKVFFSGFWSQGDGACYVGSWNAANVKAGETAKNWGDCDATKEIKRIASEFEEFAKAWPEAYFSVKHSGHYSHEFCTNFGVSLGEEADNNEKVSPEQWSQAEDSIIETARDYMRWIYRQLEKEYDYHNSDECVDENILANEYNFTIEGKRED